MINWFLYVNERTLHAATLRWFTALIIYCAPHQGMHSYCEFRTNVFGEIRMISKWIANYPSFASYIATQKVSPNASVKQEGYQRGKIADSNDYRALQIFDIRCRISCITGVVTIYK